MKLLRNYIIVLAVVAVVTVGLAAMSVLGYLTEADQVVLSPADVMTVDLNEGGFEDLAPLLNKAIARGERLEEAPFIPSTATTLPLQTRTEGGVLVGAYSLHIISMIDRNALLKDEQTGEYRRLSVADFETLLSHKAFADLPSARFSPPVLYIEESSWSQSVSLWPTEQTISYYTAEGTFAPISGNESSPEATVLELTAEEATQKPQIYTVSSPDAWSLTVTTEETTLSQSRVPGKELYFPSEPGSYTYRLTAHWDLSTQRDWYGDVTYVLQIHIAEPAPETDLPEDPQQPSSDF